MRKNYRYLVLMLLGTAAMLSACDVHFKSGHFGEDKLRALAGVEKFRIFYEKQDFVRLYDLGSPVMKASMPKEQFISAAQTVIAQLGRYKSSVLVGSSCFPNEVRLVYDTEYEKAKVRELMTWSVPDDEAELGKYEIVPVQDEFHKESQVGCPVP
jgi:hypothetical protein